MAGLRRLSTLSIDKELKDKISRTNLKTVKDVLALSPLQIMIMFHLSSKECHQLIDQLFKVCLPPHLNALTMMEQEELHSIKLGSNQLDGMLHGGLQSGSITEFAGPSGVGKTQWCLYAAVLAVMPEVCGGRDTSVVYIDTETAFRPERVIEIVSTKYPKYESDIPKYLSKIYLYQPSTINSLSEILDSLEVLAIEKGVGLLIVDSIASLARKEIAPGSTKSNIMRANQLASWAAKLKSIAQQLSICVVVTNQVTTRKRTDVTKVTEDLHEMESEETEVQPGTREGSTSHHVMPALGNTWTHFVNTRFILQYISSTHRQMIIAKSPVAPFSTFNYIIGESGIKIQELESVYSYSGCDPGLHRIKVQQGIAM